MNNKNKLDAGPLFWDQRSQTLGTGGVVSRCQ